MTRGLAEPADYVVLTEAPDRLRANLVAGALEEADIPTFVDEDNLADEFAMSQRMLGLLRVRVLVPRDRLEEARAIFLAMSQPIPLLDEGEDADAGESEERASLTPASVLLTTGVVLALLAGAFLLVRALMPSGEERSRAEWEHGAPPAPPQPPGPPPPPVLHK